MTDDGTLSPHFSYEDAIESDTATRNGMENRPSTSVLAVMIQTAHKMEAVRTILGDNPIIVTSWFRSTELNKLIGSTGEHDQGWCVDFKCPKFGTPIEIIKKLVEAGIDFDQLIQEGTWVHISFAARNRKQVLTAIFEAGKKTRYRVGL
jgi:hypothetical protein